MSALRLGLLVSAIATAFLVVPQAAATTSKSVAIVVEDGFYLIDAMGPLQVSV